MRNRVRLIGGVVALAVGFAACGNDGSEDAETTEAPAAAEESTGDTEANEPGDDDGTELTIWVNSAEPEALQALYDEFTEATGNPVELVPFPSDGYETALLQRWAAGDRPDVLQWHGNFNWVAAVDPATNLYPLDDEEFEPGVVCVGAAIRDHAGAVIGSLSCSTPKIRADKHHLDRVTKAVQGTATSLSTKLGSPMPDPSAHHDGDHS